MPASDSGSGCREYKFSKPANSCGCSRRQCRTPVVDGGLNLVSFIALVSIQWIVQNLSSIIERDQHGMVFIDRHVEIVVPNIIVDVFEAEPAIIPDLVPIFVP